MLAGGPLLGGRAHRAPGKLTARETNRRRQPPAFLASGRAPGLAVGRGPDGPSPKTHTTRDIVGLPCATGCRLVPPTAVLCRVLPRFHGAFIVRFTALSPSSQKSGDTVTFVNKDRMPRPVLPRRERLGKSDDSGSGCLRTFEVKLALVGQVPVESYSHAVAWPGVTEVDLQGIRANCEVGIRVVVVPAGALPLDAEFERTAPTGLDVRPAPAVTDLPSM